MENLKLITTPMSLTEIAIRASYQVIVGNESTLSPEYNGSGCLLYYREKLFFLTVAHVTDQPNTVVTVETNKPLVNNQSVNYCVGAMHYTDQYKVEDLDKLKKDKDLTQAVLNKIATLDFAFAELPEVIEVLQPDLDFKHHGRVSSGHKIVILAEGLDSVPVPKEQILFYGTINVNFDDGVLSRQPKLIVDCTFLREIDNFYLLTLPTVINHESEYQGTSGAPIFDTTGNFLGLISRGRVGTPYVLAFSNKAIKKILDCHLLAATHP